MPSKNLRLALLLAAVAILSGCASFKNNEVAQVGKLPDVSQYKSKPSVFVEPHFYAGLPGSVERELRDPKGELQAMIGTSIGNTGLFSRHSFKQEDKTSSDYTLTVNVYNHGNKTLAAISGAISGLTLGIIPGTGTDNHTVEVKLMDKSGALVHQLSNQDSFTSWIGVWFIPFMSSSPKKAFTETIDNQLRALLKELVESGKLKYSFMLMQQPNAA